MVAAAKVIDEHLLDGLIVGHEDVADGVAADDVADFLREVFGVIAGAFEGLRHKDDLEAGLAGNVFGVLDVAEEDEVAQAINFGVGAENVDGFADIAGGESFADVGEHFFEDGGHVSEVAGVLGIDAAGSGLGAVGEAKKQVADALEADHKFHAGEKFAGFGWGNFRNEGGDGAVDLHVEGIEFALALAQRIQQQAGTGGDAFGGRAGRFLGEAAGLDGAADDVVMRRFGSKTFDASGAHEGTSPARSGGTRAG